MRLGSGQRVRRARAIDDRQARLEDRDRLFVAAESGRGAPRRRVGRGRADAVALERQHQRRVAREIPQRRGDDRRVGRGIAGQRPLREEEGLEAVPCRRGAGVEDRRREPCGIDRAGLAALAEDARPDLRRRADRRPARVELDPAEEHRDVGVRPHERVFLETPGSALAHHRVDQPARVADPLRVVGRAQRESLVRGVEMGDGVVERGQASVARRDQLADEGRRLSRTRADNRLPHLVRLVPGRDDRSAANVDAAREGRGRAGMLQEDVERVGIDVDPRQRLRIERQQAVIEERRGAVAEDRGRETFVGQIRAEHARAPGRRD